MKTDIELLDSLIRIPSESSDIPQVNRAEEAMGAYLKAHGLFCEFEEFEGRRILFASTTPGKVQDYILNAHLDVVPAEPALFEPRIDGDRMYGRGTDDCKGCCVAIAQALCALAGTKASVGAIFTADEEIGGRTTLHMVQQGYAARKLVIVLDGPSRAIVSAEKGMLNFILRATGKTVHSSRPWEGVNAIDKLVDGYARLRAAWPKNAPGPDGDKWFDTMSADIISGGTAHNKVPDEATLLVNIRFVKPGDEKRIESFIRETTGLEVTREEFTIPVFCDENDPALQALQAAMRKAWPDHEIPFTRMMGATDARHFALNPTPIAITGCAGGGCHEIGEWINLPNIGETASMLVDFLAHA